MATQELGKSDKPAEPGSRSRRQLWRSLGEVVAASPLFLLAPLYRHWHLRWGADDAELREAMPGDELITNPSFNATRAVTIEAAPEDVWPWIAQVGYGRAGWYSYDLFDNAARPSAEQVLPEYQHLDAGDWVPMAAKVNETTAFRIKAFEQDKWMLWEKPNSTWAWRLKLLGDGRTRLVTRLRQKYAWHNPGSALLTAILLEFGDFPMMRKQLRGIRRRAEEKTAPQMPGAHLAHRRFPGKTPPFLGPRGEAVPGSIAEIEYRRLGGVDQWVMVRGESVANLPLILLHGRPGLSETALFRYFNAPLERSFTVVYWDQRGAGKSFDRAIPRSSMTVEQFVSDLDELVDAICTRVGTTKVAIFGHSWGSALGVLYAARFPEKVAAYVGSGQIGDAPAGEAASYAFALAETQRLGKQRLVRKLRAIGPPPHSAGELFTQRMTLSRLEGGMRPKALWKVGRALLHGRETSILDLRNTMRAFRFSLDAMWTEASRLDLTELVPALQMPAFFFLGRCDHWVSAEASVAYIDRLTAPSKRLIWFEHSGHEPFVDEPAKFNALMVELVRPALSSDTSARRRSS